MINAEKFKKEIRAMTDKDNDFAIMADNPTVIEICNESVRCRSCLFYKGRCNVNRTRWLLSEYTEAPIKLTRLEYEILKHVQKEGFNFIIRNNYDDLFIHETKPIKPDGSIDWCTTGKSYVLCAFNDLFQFVKFEDKDPTSVEEVLNNCEVTEDDIEGIKDLEAKGDK